MPQTLVGVDFRQVVSSPAAPGMRRGMTDMPTESGNQTETGHRPWCRDWQCCPDCREIARRYYPTAEERVARFFGGDGDSHSAYRAGQDHWFLVIVVTVFDAWRQVFRSIGRLMRRS